MDFIFVPNIMAKQDEGMDNLYIHGFMYAVITYPCHN